MRLILFVAIFLVGCGSESTPQQPDAPVDAVVDSPVDATELVNGCTLAMAVDLTAPNADRTIQFADDFYMPRCSRIRVGQSVTWTGDFSDHPLAPGILRSNMVIAQPGTPIVMTSAGTSRSVTFASEGAWAFYCPNHPPDMSGVVYVEP